MSRRLPWLQRRRRAYPSTHLQGGAQQGLAAVNQGEGGQRLRRQHLPQHVHHLPPRHALRPEGLLVAGARHAALRLDPRHAACVCVCVCACVCRTAQQPGRHASSVSGLGMSPHAQRSAHAHTPSHTHSHHTTPNTRTHTHTPVLHDRLGAERLAEAASSARQEAAAAVNLQRCKPGCQHPQVVAHLRRAGGTTAVTPQRQTFTSSSVPSGALHQWAPHIPHRAKLPPPPPRPPRTTPETPPGRLGPGPAASRARPPAARAQCHAAARSSPRHASAAAARQQRQGSPAQTRPCRCQHSRYRCRCWQPLCARLQRGAAAHQAQRWRRQWHRQRLALRCAACCCWQCA
jgi:hypothetical protein